jgi:predicted DNA-binding transcriptional regulator YafY
MNHMEYRVSLLARAINARLVIRIDYDPGWREIEPHALGYSSDSEMLLRAFQRAGASSSNENTDWKLFRVDRIRVAEPEGGTFGTPRQGYVRGDRAMRGGIIAQL